MLLNLNQHEPVIHISAMYPKEYGCAAMVSPLIAHPTNKNGVIVYDLRFDPTQFFDLSVEELKQRLFTPREELLDGVERLPLKTIHINKCPVVVPLSTLDADSAQRHKIDIAKSNEHLQMLLNNTSFANKVQQVFSDTKFPKETDPDSSIYNGFFSNADKAKFENIRNMSPKDLDNINYSFGDPKIPEMLFRYHARNFPETLSQEDKERWYDFCHTRLSNENSEYYNFDSYFAEIEHLKTTHSLNTEHLELLNKLIEHGRQISAMSTITS